MSVLDGKTIVFLGYASRYVSLSRVAQLVHSALGTRVQHKRRIFVTLESQTTGSLLQTGTTTMQRMRNRKGSMLQLTLPKLRNWLMVDIIYLLEVMQSKAYLEKN